VPELGSFVPPRLVTIQFDIGGEPVEIVFDAHKLTPEWGELSIREGLAAVIEKWNLTENGQPLAPSSESLDRLPYTVLRRMMDERAEAAGPSSEEGNGSSDTSSTPSTDSSETPATPPNGQEPSPLPIASASPSPT
jgi:hypothetical protein